MSSQRGLVAGRRFAGAFFAAGAFLAALACALAFPVAAFFFAAGFLPVVAAPDATREECFARCLVLFGAAASALDDSANAAMSATASIFMVLRIMAVTITRLMTVFDDVRNAIYSAFVESGHAPALPELSVRLGLDERSIADACRALADAHVIVLQPGSVDVVWAPPFSTS